MLPTAQRSTGDRSESQQSGGIGGVKIAIIEQGTWLAAGLTRFEPEWQRIQRSGEFSVEATTTPQKLPLSEGDFLTDLLAQRPSLIVLDFDTATPLSLKLLEMVAGTPAVSRVVTLGRADQRDALRSLLRLDCLTYLLKPLPVEIIGQQFRLLLDRQVSAVRSSAAPNGFTG